MGLRAWVIMAIVALAPDGSDEAAREAVETHDA